VYTEVYVLSIDQSTSCTKALLFDKNANLVHRHDLPHQQLISAEGWVEHDPSEIYTCLIQAVKKLLEASGIDRKYIQGVAISNQRETAIVWDKTNGHPLYNAIVWQCARGLDICNQIEEAGNGEHVRRKTGIPLSPYYSAAKMAWVLQNVPEAKRKAALGELCCSTMDSWLVYKLAGGTPKTDYSNASRTQLFNVESLVWDAEVCDWFDLTVDMLPEVCDSDSLFGYTDLEGLLPVTVPINGVMGDSHGALFAQSCLEPGMVKATYGTGSSVMMNVGKSPVFSDMGIVTSLAWRTEGIVYYVLEGNINYTGAVIKWLEEELGLIASSKEVSSLAKSAGDIQGLYLVPAFSGLGAPYWKGDAKAMLYGMTRNTGKAEIVRAAEECIAYQIADIVKLMEAETRIKISELKVDGGPTRDDFLMQFQSDIIDAEVKAPDIAELSGLGPALAAGIALGFYEKEHVFMRPLRADYAPKMEKEKRQNLHNGWKAAVQMVLGV